MTFFSDPFTYMFHPNPGMAMYTSPKAFTLLLVCILFLVGSFAVSRWRKSQSNPVTRKLSRSWSSALLWFGIIGLILVVSRVETVGYLAMRFLWYVWAAALLAYIVVQYKLFRARHYEQLPREHSKDPREKYLPKKKR